MSVELGDEVKDIVSGFRGIALARMTSLHEATQFRVHPTTLDDSGRIRDSVWIEETRLVVVKAIIRTYQDGVNKRFFINFRDDDGWQVAIPIVENDYVPKQGEVILCGGMGEIGNIIRSQRKSIEAQNANGFYAKITR